MTIPIRILLVLFCIACWYASYCFVKSIYEGHIAMQKDSYKIQYAGFDSQQEYEDMKRLLKYHGVLSAWYDWRADKWYFMRNGKRCELWEPPKWKK